MIQLYLSRSHMSSAPTIKTKKSIRFVELEAPLTVKITSNLKVPEVPLVIATKFAPKETPGPLVIDTKKPGKMVMAISNSEGDFVTPKNGDQPSIRFHRIRNTPP